MDTFTGTKKKIQDPTGSHLTIRLFKPGPWGTYRRDEVWHLYHTNPVTSRHILNCEQTALGKLGQGIFKERGMRQGTPRLVGSGGLQGALGYGRF